MYERGADGEGSMHRCLATHPLGEVPCERAGVVEFGGLRYCAPCACEAEAAMRVNLEVQADNPVCRWTEETEGLDNSLFAGLLEDARREIVSGLRRAEAEHEEARDASRRTCPAELRRRGLDPADDRERRRR